MDGILGKIKDAGRDALGTFVVLEDGTQMSIQPRTPATTPTAATAAPVAGAVAPDPEFIQQLQHAVEASDKAAYAQFNALYAAMSMLTDERARVQAALTATQTAHKLTAADVSAAIDDRLRILATEKGAFEKAAQAEMQHAVGDTLQQAEKTRAEIAKKQEEIRQLAAKASELEQQAADARAAIDAGSARFAVSYAVVEAQLQAERARVAQFVTPTSRP